MNPVRDKTFGMSADSSASRVSNGVKKILLVTDAWAPQRNGVVMVQDRLIPTLSVRGYSVTVIEPGQFRTIPLPMYPEIRLAFGARRRIAKMIREIQPDAVHVMVEGPLGWAARSVCMKQGIAFTSWYHSHLQLYVKAYLHGFLRPIQVLMRRFHSTATRTYVSTESLKRELESHGYKNVVVVPLGVDTGLFTRDPAPALGQFQKPVFVYFGRLAIEKSPEEFLKLDLPGTKVVIGNGPLLPMLRKKYPEARFFGAYKVGKEFVGRLSQCDVFVFPSRTETFGLVVLEALACGIPVAAHEVMGPRDIITEGRDGYLSDDLRTAALKCLELSRDDCRATAEQYSWEHSADAFIKNLVPVR